MARFRAFERGLDKTLRWCNTWSSNSGFMAAGCEYSGDPSRYVTSMPTVISDSLTRYRVVDGPELQLIVSPPMMIAKSIGDMWKKRLETFIPAFTRKYQVNCNVCHTRKPRLNPFGERFLENGYQLPGTEDGGIVGKLKYGDLTLDQMSNYLGVLFATSGVEHTELKRDIEGAGDQTELGTPTILRLFTAGTITNNVGFFVETTTLLGRSSELELGRAFVTLNNLGGMNLGHLRVGRFDPSAFFSMTGGRPQFAPIGPKLAPPFGTFATPTVNRWAVFQRAYASKFYGLFERSRTGIQPYDSTLFHSPEKVGVDIHRRPFGDWFLYQAGTLNGGNERAGDSNNSKDWYVMTRLDFAQSEYFSANLSGFAYFGNHNVKVSTNADVSRSRYGIGARMRYKWLDVYGASTMDRLTDLPSGMEATFDSTATGK